MSSSWNFEHDINAQAKSTNSSLPEHVAIILDGNGRWAERQSLPRTSGHQKGVDAVRSVIELANKTGIGTLSLFVFSSENYQRPTLEVNFLLKLLAATLKKEAKELNKQNIKVKIIGDYQGLPKFVQGAISHIENLTSVNTGMNLVLAINYGGKWDITQAIKIIIANVQNGKLNLNDIDEHVVESYLATSQIPQPDLMIRTSGELRISNFYLWQLAYTELYFTDVLWPDFNAKELQKAIDTYNTRKRRFGQVCDV